jgi:hypothetical protein
VGDFPIVHFALHKLKILPSTLDLMSREEKILVYASILVRIEDEKKHDDELKRKMPKRGLRR